MPEFPLPVAGIVPYELPDQPSASEEHVAHHYQVHGKLNGWCDPYADLGAPSNGTDDDTDYVAEALDSADYVWLNPERSWNLNTVGVRGGCTFDMNSAAVKHADEADDHMITLASNTEVMATILGGRIDGNKANQIAPRRAIFLSNASGGVSDASHQISGTRIRDCSGSGIFIDTQTRGCLIERIRSYNCDEYGVVAGGTDCYWNLLNIGQSGLAGVWIVAESNEFTNGKVWLSGRVPTTLHGVALGRYPAFLVERGTAGISGFNIQQNYGDGIRVFRQGGTDIKGVSIDCRFDSNNIAASSPSAYYAVHLADAYGCNVRGTVTNSLAAFASGIVQASIACSSGANDNDINMTGDPAAWTADFGGTILDNRVYVNGVQQ